MAISYETAADLMEQKKYGPELIEQVRELLKGTGKPYIIENVPGAPLINASLLCGSSFGLEVQRHRLFECSFYLMTMPCVHSRQKQDKPPLHRLTGRSRVVGCYGHGRGKGDDKALWSKAMGITWMTRQEMAQAIPPAYTEFIGNELMRQLQLKGELDEAVL